MKKIKDLKKKMIDNDETIASVARKIGVDRQLVMYHLYRRSGQCKKTKKATLIREYFMKNYKIDLVS